jgi:mitochondrial import inner membrane translocase subunit TIM9
MNNNQFNPQNYQQMQQQQYQMQMQQQQQTQLIQELEFKELLNAYNLSVKKCFTHCITNFKTKTLTNEEIKCSQSCAEKFFGYYKRCGKTFQSLQDIFQQ